MAENSIIHFLGICDNGGEFNNTLFRDMSELLGIYVITTAAESPL